MLPLDRGVVVRRRLAAGAPAFLLFLGMALALQWMDGAFSSELGGYPDEPAHVVTGLMTRDFLREGDWSDPMGFAKEYYAHYPKVAFGHWPPFFYVVQSAWTLIFPASCPSLLVLMSLISALLATSVYRVIRAEFSPAAGLAIGSLLLLLPVVQQSGAMVMSDNLVALLCFWAMVSFGRYLDAGRWRDATAFGLCASAAMLTKGNGLVLGFIPPLAVLLGRRPGLLKRPSFWWPALLVLILCGPWFWLTREMAGMGMLEDGASLRFTATAIRYYAKSIAEGAGLALVAPIVVGLVARLASPRGGLWDAAAALLLGGLVFPCLVPACLEDRYLLPAAAPALMFLAAGVAWIAGRLPPRRADSGRKSVVVGLAVTLAFAAGSFRLPKKVCRGYAGGVARLLSEPGSRDSVWLVSSDATGEGVIISEAAMQGRWPGPTLLRSSKVLSRSDWLGRGYQNHFDDPGDLAEFIDRERVRYVVVDTTVADDPGMVHHFKLIEAIASRPRRWELIHSSPLTRGAPTKAGALRVYRRSGPASGEGPALTPGPRARPGGSPPTPGIRPEPAEGGPHSPSSPREGGAES